MTQPVSHSRTYLLADLEVDRLRVELVVREPAGEEARLAP